jgi:signal transduction histidine kinase
MVLDYQIRGRISIVKNYTMEPFEIICNEGKLHQAMLNILSNAVDAISGFGEIKLITERIEHTLCISIIDNGCGIPNDQISKLTDPFFTTKDPGKGTGLGLAVVYITIQELNGSLEFQSQEGLGTSVIIKIPSELSNQQ